MFWSKLCKSTWNCAWNLTFAVFISPIVWNMCENLPYESVYFKELHNEQECYWATINRAGAAVVSTITSLHNLTSAWPVMLLANQCLPYRNQLLARIMSLLKSILGKGKFLSTSIDYVKVKENCAYQHFAFLKWYEVPNKFALKFYIMYLFCFACLVLNIQRGDVTENVSQMILKFLTFNIVKYI